MNYPLEGSIMKKFAAGAALLAVVATVGCGSAGQGSTQEEVSPMALTYAKVAVEFEPAVCTVMHKAVGKLGYKHTEESYVAHYGSDQSHGITGAESFRAMMEVCK